MSKNTIPEPKEWQGPMFPGSTVNLSKCLDPTGWSHEDALEVDGEEYLTLIGAQIAQDKDRTVVTGNGTQVFKTDSIARRGSEVKILFRPETETKRTHALVVYFHKGRMYAYVQLDAYTDVPPTEAEGLWRD